MYDGGLFFCIIALINLPSDAQQAGSWKDKRQAKFVKAHLFYRSFVLSLK